MLIWDVGVFSRQFRLVRRPLGHPARALPSQTTGASSLWPCPHFSTQAHPLLHPSSILSGFGGTSGASGPPQPGPPTLLCGILAAAGSEASEGPAPGHQGTARAPHISARSGAAGVLPGRAPRLPNPDPSYPPRERLRPAADSPRPNGFSETWVASTSFAASQNGRQPAQQLRVPKEAGRSGTSLDGAAQARWDARAISRKLRMFPALGAQSV